MDGPHPPHPSRPRSGLPGRSPAVTAKPAPSAQQALWACRCFR